MTLAQVDQALPPLLAISHGTSSLSGRHAVTALVDALVAARPDLAIGAGFVDVQQPDVPSSLSLVAEEAGAVVVPLLLSAGFHVNVDLRGQIRHGDRLAKALGPDDRLVRILLERLDECGLRATDRVVLACAGSTDPRAVADCHDTGARLSLAVGRPVRVGFISAAQPSLADAVSAERAAGAGARVVVSSYLLAPGYFAELARAVHADLVTDPLLVPGREPDSTLVGLVFDRYDESIGSEPRS
ncbi:MAG: CbiX/SirB N-terminal domain-containing protein [Lacisediminihabitans sp.]